MVKMETSSGDCHEAAVDAPQKDIVDKLSAIIKDIEQDDLGNLRRHLDEMEGQDISGCLVKTKLPQKYKAVASTVMTTPLRVAITWRNTEALRLIFASRCCISEEDKSLGLQKILRHIGGETEISIVRMLLEKNTVISSPVHYTMAIEKLIIEGKLELLKNLSETHFSGGIPAVAKGFLCVALASRGRCTTAPDRSPCFQERWSASAKLGMMGLMRSGFNPREFLQSTGWASLETKYFHTVVLLLPYFIQTMPVPCHESIARILRRASRDYWYPMLKDSERAILHALPQLLWLAKYDLKHLLSTACLSPKFENHIGFSEWNSEKRDVSELQDACRHAIRRSLTTGNVLEGIENIACFPQRLKSYILLCDLLEECGLPTEASFGLN